jgi:selenocysteine-specific elongation factor
MSNSVARNPRLAHAAHLYPNTCDDLLSLSIFLLMICKPFPQPMSVSDPSSTYCTVGVIGHIDHGKTSLVGKLTGVDTDTHPEEKRRGITIDLGFASMTEGAYTFAFIDAPGHQKYIGNLLAGVSAVDIGLLVVACDQGIQEQTLEHVAVLGSLGAPTLIVALSRIDLCDAARQQEITEELEVFLSDYGFADFPIVPVSSVSGQGLERLKEELQAAGDRSQLSRGESPGWQDEAPFRMPIDRVLHVAGRGLVVAGTIWSGQVQCGDMLQLAGRSGELRVREIEIHGQSAAQSRRGMRTALNLAGSDAEAERGDELIAPAGYPVANRLLVHLQVYPETQPLRLPATVQLHSATTSIAARLIGAKQLAAGQDSVVIVEAERPMVATCGQNCLFRRPYPVGSFAGGKILAVMDDLPALARKSNKAWIALGHRLLDAPPAERLLAWVKFLGEWAIDRQWCLRQLALPVSQFDVVLKELTGSPEVLRMDDKIVSAEHIQLAGKLVTQALASQAEGSDDAWSVEDAVVKRVAHAASAAVVRKAIETLVAEQTIVSLNGLLAIASEKTRLTKKQRAQMSQLADMLQGVRTPPTMKELADRLSITLDSVKSLTRHLVQQRLLLDIGHDFLMSVAVFEELCEELRGRFSHTSELTVPEIKDIWGVTRKHVIPILEYCDRERFTIRRGDVRLAGPRLQTAEQSSIEDNVENLR